MSKPTVRYIEAVAIRVGYPALIMPIDHPSDMVSNTVYAQTSPVVEYDDSTGIFETQNSVYIPESSDI